jgi:hypothetical protein
VLRTAPTTAPAERQEQRERDRRRAAQQQPAALCLGQAARESEPDPVPLRVGGTAHEEVLGAGDADAFVGDVDGRRFGGVPQGERDAAGAVAVQLA